MWFVVNVENMKEVELVCYDSLCTSEKITGWKRECGLWIIGNINEIFTTVLLLEDKYIDSCNHKFKNFSSYPQQPDYVNCGLYALLGIQYFLNDKKTKFNFGIEEIIAFKATIRKFYKDELIKDYNDRKQVQNKADLDLLFGDSDDDFLN